MLSDFLPSGGTPQLPIHTIIVPGDAATFDPRSVQPDLEPKSSENARVELSISSGHAVARTTTSLRFRLTPGDGLETYLGAWGHMLMASADLAEMLHGHPAATTDSFFRDGKTLHPVSDPS